MIIKKSIFSSSSNQKFTLTGKLAILKCLFQIDEFILKGIFEEVLLQNASVKFVAYDIKIII